MFLRIVLFFVIFLLPACEDKDLNQTNIPDHLIQKNNKGVGQMGYYDYASAYDTFSEIYQQQPEWRLAHLNLIIAMLNRQQTDDEARALQMALDISNKDPNDLTAHYLAAILLYNQGDCETAIKHLDVVVKADESDAYAWYFKAQCLLQTGDMLQAVSLFKKSIKQDPHLRSAYYGLFLSSQRAGNMDLAEKSLEDYQKLELNPKARLAEIKYTRMGSKAEAQSTLIKADNKLINIAKKPYFLQANVVLSNQPIKYTSLADLSLRGQTSFVTRIDEKLLAYQQIDSQWQSNVLSMDFTDRKGHISWGDFNNDQLLDIFLSGQRDQIFIQDENKKFNPVDMQSYGFTATSSKQVKLFDADHDGDIDIGMINQGGEFALWNNNGNNTFRNISDEIISENDNQGFLQVLVSDVDGDRDLDVLLLHDQYVLMLINDRMWSYQAETHSIDHNMQSMSSAYNAEGLFQLWILSKDQQISVMTYDFTKKNFISKNHSLAIPAKSFELADINGSGINELLLFNNETITIFDTFNFNILDSIEFEQDQTDFFVLHGLKGPELLVYNDFSFSHYPASLNRGDYMLLGFSGKHEKANSMRSNSLGLGAEFFIINGRFSVKANYHQNSHHNNQSYQPISIATGGGKVDYLSMEWSDGVFQTELQLEANRYHLLTETQRQLSSCPVLFANDGTTYKFISDVLGVGGMGFAIGKGKYATPRPWENYLLTEDQLNAEGKLSFYLTEPMEESAYIDSIELEIYDVPDDWFAVLDERMATNDIQATGKIQFFQNTILPIKVTNHLGEDLSDFNQYVDKKPIPITELHPYFLGYAAEEQLYTFELAQQMQGDFILVMNGWVEYGYSQTGFAAWQAGLSLKTPSLELLIDGKWQSWLPNFGYPAGMPRTASVPFSTGSKQFAAFRIRTNQEVYFDQISLIENQQPPEFNKYNLALKQASLKTVGFPERIDLPNRYPVYDFNKKAPFWDTRYMEGAYTKFGNVLPLIKAKDNALAIIAAGEGIYFEFENTLPRKKANTKRYYLLKFHGWAKDMDMMTQYGETLAPIPSTGQISEQAEALNRDYNARFMAGK